MANSRYGRLSTRSMNQERARSTQPPANPATSPITIPMTLEITVAALATISEGRAPYNQRANRSRPVLGSTPNQWALFVEKVGKPYWSSRS